MSSASIAVVTAVSKPIGTTVPSRARWPYRRGRGQIERLLHGVELRRHETAPIGGDDPAIQRPAVPERGEQPARIDNGQLTTSRQGNPRHHIGPHPSRTSVLTYCIMKAKSVPSAREDLCPGYGPPCRCCHTLQVV